MQLKRILVSLLVVVLMLSATVIAFAEDTVLSTSGATFDVAVVTTPAAEDGTLLAKPGDKIDVSITITNNPGVAVFETTLKYDATLLEPVVDAEGKVVIESGVYTFVDSKREINGITVSEGQIRFVSDLQNTTNITETGVVAKLSFTVKEGAHGDTALELANTLAYTGAYASVAANVTNVTVSNHILGEAEVVEADCLNAGYTVQKCTVEGCDYELVTNPVEALGHNEVAFGNGGIKCDRCGDILKAEEEVTSEPEESETETETEPVPQESGSLLWLWIVIAVVVVVGAAAAVYFFVIKKKN